MSESTWAHLGILALFIPVISGVGWLIWHTAQQDLKVNVMFEWFTNHGSNITGYKPGDEKRKT